MTKIKLTLSEARCQTTLFEVLFRLFHDSVPVTVYVPVSQLSTGQLRKANLMWKTLHGQNIYICILPQWKRWKIYISVVLCFLLFDFFYHLFPSINFLTYILYYKERYYSNFIWEKVRLSISWKISFAFKTGFLYKSNTQEKACINKCIRNH